MPQQLTDQLPFGSSLAAWARKYTLTSGSPQDKGGKRLRWDLAIVKHPATNQKTAEVRSINASWVDPLEKKIEYDTARCYLRFKVDVEIHVSIMYVDGLRFIVNNGNNREVQVNEASAFKDKTLK